MPDDFDRALAEVLDEFRDVYGMNLTQAVIDAFREVLAGCTAQEITRAAVAHMTSSKFAPRPAELLALIKAARTDAQKSQTKRQPRENCNRLIGR